MRKCARSAQLCKRDRSAKRATYLKNVERILEVSLLSCFDFLASITLTISIASSEFLKVVFQIEQSVHQTHNIQIKEIIFLKGSKSSLSLYE